jgi:hypothetical protein
VVLKTRRLGEIESEYRPRCVNVQVSKESQRVNESESTSRLLSAVLYCTWLFVLLLEVPRGDADRVERLRRGMEETEGVVMGAPQCTGRLNCRV